MSEELNMNNETEIDTASENSNNEYLINFTLSYSQFVKARGRDEIYDNEIKELVGQMVTFYETEASIDDIKNFFEVRDDHDADLISRNYTVTAEVVGKNDNNKIIFVKFILKIGSKIITV